MKLKPLKTLLLGRIKLKNKKQMETMKFEIMLRYQCQCLSALAQEQRFEKLEDINKILEPFDNNEEGGNVQVEDKPPEEILVDIMKQWEAVGGIVE